MTFLLYELFLHYFIFSLLFYLDFIILFNIYFIIFLLNFYYRDERLGWMADAQVSAPVINFYLFQPFHNLIGSY